MANTNTNVKENKLEIKHVYLTENGVVVGKVYGGGLEIHPARNFTADSAKELKLKVRNAFDLESLDAEFGFDKLLAAGVVIVDEASVEIEGQVFTSVTKTNHVIGDEDLFQELVEAGQIVDENQ